MSRSRRRSRSPRRDGAAIPNALFPSQQTGTHANPGRPAPASLSAENPLPSSAREGASIPPRLHPSLAPRPQHPPLLHPSIAPSFFPFPWQRPSRTGDLSPLSLLSFSFLFHLSPNLPLYSKPPSFASFLSLSLFISSNVSSVSGLQSFESHFRKIIYFINRCATGSTPAPPAAHPRGSGPLPTPAPTVPLCQRTTKLPCFGGVQPPSKALHTKRERNSPLTPQDVRDRATRSPS